MNRRLSCAIPTLAALATVFLVLRGLSAVAAAPGQNASSEWVHLGSDGRLVYKTTPRGDRIMDFSYAGYMGGGVALPDVPVKRTVRPSGTEDDTPTIQAAIDEVAQLPLEGRFRGTVLLAPGVYPCRMPLSIGASGVVLRGSEATGSNASTIKMTGTPHTAITIRMADAGRGQRQSTGGAKQDGGETTIADSYVPSGANSFTVLDSAGLNVGDTIEIRRPVTKAWIQFMQMDDLTRDGKPQTWLRPGGNTVCERRITAISGNTLKLDVPLSDSLDAKYLNPPGTTVAKINPLRRVAQAGIENLHIVSPLQPISHSQPHFTAIRVNGEDCWIRDLMVEETMNSIAVNGRRITLQRVSVVRKALHQGSSRPAEFAPNAGQVLLDRCSVRADNVCFAGTGSGQFGPIVLLHCSFEGSGRAESHQRWSTGMLYDSCSAPAGGFDFRNRGSMGSGHGWTMGWGVAWNCVARDYVIQNPPGAVNWMIGCVGTNRPMPQPFGSGPALPKGIEDSPGKPVTPSSLYLAQLAERLGAQALKNLGY